VYVVEDNREKKPRREEKEPGTGTSISFVKYPKGMMGKSGMKRVESCEP